MRNCCKYVVYKDKKELTADVKNIYNAPNKKVLSRNLRIWRGNGEEMGRKVSLCHTVLAEQLGWPDRLLPVPTGNNKDNLYHKSHWEPEREKSESIQNQSVHSLRTTLSKRRYICHLWKLRRNGHSPSITGAWLWTNLCLCLKTESRYKSSLTTESGFTLHKIMDSAESSLFDCYPENAFVGSGSLSASAWSAEGANPRFRM